jgi:hypothetical protein
MRTQLLRQARDARGQSMMEFALVLPLLCLVALGVVEVSFALLDQHVVTRLSREGANLISRDVTLQVASQALRSMTSRPLDLDSNAAVIFTVIRKGATTNTPNYNEDIISQRFQFGALSGVNSSLRAPGGSFAGPPNYQALNSDNDTSLQVTGLPPDIVLPLGGMLYVAEVYTTHQLLTPVGAFGLPVPDRLYSIAYF